jgi:hypothetical protein
MWRRHGQNRGFSHAKSLTEESTSRVVGFLYTLKHHSNKMPGNVLKRNDFEIWHGVCLL